MKHVILALLLSLGLPVLAVAAGLPVQLRSEATINGDAIRLGDLWDNLGDKAGTAIAAAPQPGRRVTLDARWLAAVAGTNGIDWHPSSPFDRIVVERAGRTVDPASIESAVREALAMQGLPQGTGFELSSRSALAIVIPADAQPDVAVHDLDVDQRTQRFSATVEVPAGAPNAIRVRVSGRTFTTTKIPVLNRTVARGDVIGERDIDWLDVRDDNMRRDIALEPRELVGMEPRFQVKAGMPVRLADLQRPILVSRNSTVTMVLRTPYMTLTSQGRATEDGGRGDIVHVTNTQTKQVVEALVEGPGTVSVALNTPRALSN
ncbi:MAG: flagellar basal body P-ring formation chaperone FlgA [Magnetospirillum sp.]|nr:flagellar basal body P-ring formation chaperone FlgA [Magnetospirillum sp.]